MNALTDVEVPSVPAMVQPVPMTGEGPASGIGGNRSTYADWEMVGGVPSVQPGTIYQAPGHAYRYGEEAWLQGPYQGGHGDLYSWRVKAPAVPFNSLPYTEVAYQIFRNGDVIGHGDVVWAAPRVPTGGYVPTGGQLYPRGGNL